MPKNQPILDDILSLGSSLFGNLMDARHELKSQAKMHVESVVQKLDLVTREEFDAAFAMLSKARALQDDLQERLERIEAHLKLSTPASKKNNVKTDLRSVKKATSKAKHK